MAHKHHKKVAPQPIETKTSNMVPMLPKRKAKPKSKQTPTSSPTITTKNTVGNPPWSQSPGSAPVPYDPYPNLEPSPQNRTGYLQNTKGDKFPFWLTNMQAAFSMGGYFGQAQLSRTFYPRNLGAATLTLQGICPGSTYYQRLAEFIRDNYLVFLQGNSQGDGLMHLVLEKDNTPSRRLMKGPRQTYDLYGYIQSITRGARRFDYFPTFQFDFIISKSNTTNGLFDSSIVQVHKLQTFTNLIQGFDTGSSATQFVQDPSKKGGGTTSTQKSNPNLVSNSAGVASSIGNAIANSVGAQFLK